LPGSRRRNNKWHKAVVIELLAMLQVTAVEVEVEVEETM